MPFLAINYVDEVYCPYPRFTCFCSNLVLPVFCIFLVQALNSLASSFSPLSSNGITQQQQLAHQPQQSLPQMYPQVHIPHYPNFVPYRHMFSPVYVPPIALPNYSSNPAYPHPSNGNNYLMMPGGSSQIPAASMKYAAAQYKPVPGGSPTAYASYNNSAGFTISPPGAVGSTAGPDDITRIKYKDHGLYMPNQQVIGFALNIFHLTDLAKSRTP